MDEKKFKWLIRNMKKNEEIPTVEFPLLNHVQELILKLRDALVESLQTLESDLKELDKKITSLQNTENSNAVDLKKSLDLINKRIDDLDNIFMRIGSLDIDRIKNDILINVNQFLENSLKKFESSQKKDIELYAKVDQLDMALENLELSIEKSLGLQLSKLKGQKYKNWFALQQKLKNERLNRLL